MASRGTKKGKEIEIAVIPPAKRELVLEGDPETQLQFAHKAAKALMSWVEQKPNKVMINGQQFLEFSDWQIIGRFYGATVGVEWARRIEREGKYYGYEARTVVYRNGEVISSAEAACLIAEWNWGGNPKKKVDEYAVKSMAQTRASSKALRQAFGWVAELAGMKSTPAEEMDGIAAAEPKTRTVMRVQHDEDAEERAQEPEVLDYTDGDMRAPIGASVTPKPLPKSAVDKQRARIKDLLDENSATLLVSKQDYEEACERLIGMKLEPWHFKDIIEALERLPQ